MVGTHKTTVSTSDGVTRVTYHSTDVVTFDAEKITLDSGGWLTATTKKRINQASDQFDLGYHVYQLGGAWLVDIDGDRLSPRMWADGIIINRDFTKRGM